MIGMLTFYSLQEDRHQTSSSTAITSKLLMNSDNGDYLYDVKSSPQKVYPPPSTTPRQQVPYDKTRTEGRPKGGSLKVTLNGFDLFKDDTVPTLDVTVKVASLHAPMIERILEIPIDIQDGVVDGSLNIKSNSPRTWQLPRIEGHLKAKNVDMHFWDAPDHVSKADFELLFENNRIYFHNASGHFGALPLVLTGEHHPITAHRCLDIEHRGHGHRSGVWGIQTDCYALARRR